MRNLLKIKKRKISIFLLLIFNQFLLNSYALNNKKINKFDSGEHSSNNNIKDSKLFITERVHNKDQYFFNRIEELEKFFKELDSSNSFENLKNTKQKNPPKDTKPEKFNKDSIKKDIENKNSSQKKKKKRNKSKIKKDILNKLPLPSQSAISTSEFIVPSRGYVNLKGPKITLDLQETDTINTLKLLGKLGNYGIVIIDDNDADNGINSDNPKITANFEEVDYSYVFNSILLSANLQAVIDNNIIFIGKNILNKSIKPKISKTYRLNQVSAASVADYLSTLGAKISKVLLVSGSNLGVELRDSYVNKKEFKDELKNSYGLEGGPLFGLVGTTDLRLQTITLIGSEELMKTAEKYIKSLDLRHRQVALTIKIIDVSLTKSDIKNNMFELRTGDTRIISNGGFALGTANQDPGDLPSVSNVSNVMAGGIPGGKFINWLDAKITNENAKILASPTLILGENPNLLSSGAATIDDGLSAATIGRPFKNEGFIKVGETVITKFNKTVTEGTVTCSGEEGTAGITFGAKVEKIDDNGYVTFALSPAISSVTKTVEIAGCGIQNTLSVRKLDTGSIRVKNGDTLILTGVLKDEDNVVTSKVPILGDVPILGSLFRKNTTQKRKSELIILVTPRILKDK
tara:strand:- start:3961 stop:5853 length:1893 start_codon:yes stop_codon:yes gene_type:complete